MTATHTPGPWIIDTGSEYDAMNPPKKGTCVGSAELAFTTVAIRQDNQDHFACPSVEILNETGMANARLIAAAPEMYDIILAMERTFSLWGGTDLCDYEEITDRIAALRKTIEGE